MKPSSNYILIGLLLLFKMKLNDISNVENDLVYDKFFTFSIPKNLDRAVTQLAHDKTMLHGRRISKADIVRDAILQYFQRISQKSS